ncbi:MAG TPA: branched-chain amino acid ABC transporter permease [Actinomycetota bacterium]|nr:branched-chain amino acid ABC transporter permease [Actinomycetota bacterium]
MSYYVGWVGLTAIAVGFPWLYPEPYYHVLGFNVLMMATMGTSWNILGGYAGYKSLGHSAFFGLGAYAVAIAARYWSWDPLWSSPVLAVGVSLVAAGLGWVMLRTTGSAFVIASIAMLLIFRILALNLRGITGGSSGISQPLPPWPAQYAQLPFYYYMLSVWILSVAAAAFIRRTRFGLGLQAIREDEEKASAVGVNTTAYKILAFVVSAYFVALAGGIWSYRQVHISPIFAFDIMVAVEMILVAMLGGLGTVFGPTLGAVILVPLADFLRFRLGSTQLHIAVLGVAMLAVILGLPKGLVPTAAALVEKRGRQGSAYAGAKRIGEMLVGKREESSGE